MTSNKFCLPRVFCNLDECFSVAGCLPLGSEFWLGVVQKIADDGSSLHCDEHGAEAGPYYNQIEQSRKHYEGLELFFYVIICSIFVRQSREHFSQPPKIEDLS